jgi:putative ABC transport system permease protein
VSLRFALTLARRELRASARRIGVYMISISLGVAGLVAIHGFTADVSRSVDVEAEVLLGANVRLQSQRPFPEPVLALVDSLAAAGHDHARLTSVVSMVLAPRTNLSRLLQVRGVDPGYPFYGEVRSDPAGAWPPAPGEALVDPAVLTMLDARPGDELMVGEVTVRIAGTVEDLLGDFALQTAVGPRVWLGHETLDRAGLLAFGSLAQYEHYLVLPSREERLDVEESYRPMLTDAQVRWTTAESQAQRLTNSVGYLGRYLGLVGLAALLLGGVGVGSAVHVFVRERRTAVSVLRCLGAHQRSVFAAYLLQAAVLGFAGAAVGALVGVAAQQGLPLLLAEILPVRVTTELRLAPVAAGLGMGVWVALLFAWLPLLAVRDVPPLRALREDVDPNRRRWDPARLTAWAALGASIFALSVLQAPEQDQGVGFALGLAGTIGVLWAAGWALVQLTRRYFPRRAPYPVRQGIANLFRPQNQTVAITLALGFGVFAVATVLQVETALIQGLGIEEREGQPNLVLFDVQPDQEQGVLERLPAEARERATTAPLVPARIAAINGLGPAELAELPDRDQPDRWAIRREYRNTWRDTLSSAETLIAGRWWDADEARAAAPEGVAPLARISLETELADDLEVGLGDRITWDFGGRTVESVVTSLRTVDWARFEPNFFVVFEPGVIEEAPRMSVVITRIEDATARAALQTSMVRAYPNVSSLDLTRVQDALERVLARVNAALHFLGLFTAVTGLIVLAGALAASRFQRMRESALLRTLGARRDQVRVVLLTEYLALGTLASLTGLVLAVVAAWALTREVFEVSYLPSLPSLLGLWLVVTGLTLVMGLGGSAGLLGRPPLPVLRRAAE